MLALLALAIAPSAALFLFFYLRDKHRKEPPAVLLVTFILGAGSLGPAVAASLILQRLTSWHPATRNLFHAFAGSLLIVGLVEESAKFAVVRFYSYRRPEFDEPYDGIMYSVMAALGFATLENIMYVVSGGSGTGIMRAILAVPSHAFDAVLIGYFLGEAKFARSTAWGNVLAGVGLGLAVLAHGLYDFIVFTLDKLPANLASLVVFALLSWVIILKATGRQARQSPSGQPQLVDLKNELAADASQREQAAPDQPPGRAR